jgi:hypothetical protein
MRYEELTRSASIGESAPLHLDGEGLTGVFIETFLLVVVPVSGDEPMPRPDLHGLRVDPEQARHFVQCEHALLAQPLIARAEPVVAPKRSTIRG